MKFWPSNNVNFPATRPCAISFAQIPIGLVEEVAAVRMLLINASKAGRVPVLLRPSTRNPSPDSNHQRRKLKPLPQGKKACKLKRQKNPEELSPPPGKAHEPSEPCNSGLVQVS